MSDTDAASLLHNVSLYGNTDDDWFADDGDRAPV
jgi:hypothetical protein